MIKDMLKDKRIIRSALIVCLLLFTITIVDIYNSIEDKNPLDNIRIEQGNKYYGWVTMGLAPNSNPRTPTEKDIDTGIKFKDGDNIYALVESRTWNTGDYGKTFLTKIN